MAEFIFDGSARTIQINPDQDYQIINGQRWYSFSTTDLYSAWKRWVQEGEGAKFPPAFRVIGGQDIGGGILVGSYLFMQTISGWIGIPPDVDDIIIQINGNLYPDIAGSPVMKKHPQYSSTLMLRLSNLTEVVQVSTGSGLSPEQDARLTAISGNVDSIPADVWATQDAQKLLDENLGKAEISSDDRHVTITKRSDGTVSHEYDISADKRIRTPV